MSVGQEKESREVKEMSKDELRVMQKNDLAHAE